jgi:hypothetical protein
MSNIYIDTSDDVDLMKDVNFSKTKKSFFGRKTVRTCKKIACWFFVFMFCCVLAVVAYMVYIFKPQFTREIEVVDGMNVVKREISMDYGTKLKFRNYTGWEDYVLNWNPCVEIESISDDQKFMRSHLVKNKDIYVRYSTQQSLLMESQVLYSRSHESYQSRQGNFTMPAMYMDASSRGVMPCVCSLLLDGRRQSLDREIRKFKDIIHMFNPAIVNTLDDPYTQKAQIDLPLLNYLKPFWMKIPSELEVHFSVVETGQDNGLILVKKNVTFRDPVNIVNLLNCISLLRVTRPEWSV